MILFILVTSCALLGDIPVLESEAKATSFLIGDRQLDFIGGERRVQMVLQNGRKTEVTLCDDLCLLCGQSYLKLDNLFKFAEQDTIELQLECFVTFFRQWLDLFQ